jgi:hypothetical protein
MNTPKESSLKSDSPFNPIPWGVAIGIVIIAFAVAQRPLSACEPTSFEVFRFFKLNYGGCNKSQVEAVPDGIKGRVYIQIANASQTEKMTELKAVLVKEGFLVPAFENIQGKGKTPAKADVRFFNDSDSDLANNVVQHLRKAGFASAYAHRISGLKAPAKSLEIWLPNP